MNQLMTSFKWLALWEIQNSNVKFVKKKLLESSISKCIWKMFIKDLKRIQMWWVWQKFHTKYWIEETYYSCSWKKIPCDQCGKHFARGCNLKVHKQILHEKYFEFNCDDCGKNFSRALYLKKHNIKNHHELQKTLDWNYKLQLIMKIKRFNCDQCGKNFARAFNLQKHTNSSWFTKNTGLKLQITLPYCSWRCFDFPQIKYEFWNNI